VSDRHLARIDFEEIADELPVLTAVKYTLES